MERKRISLTYEKSLSSNIGKVKENLEPKDILDDLIAQGLMKIDEAQELRELPTKEQRQNSLLTKVLFFGDRFSVFLDALRNHGYEYLANFIEEAERKPAKLTQDEIDGPVGSKLCHTNPIEVKGDFSDSGKGGKHGDEIDGPVRSTGNLCPDNPIKVKGNFSDSGKRDNNMDEIDGPVRSVLCLTKPIEIEGDFLDSEKGGNIKDPTVKDEYDKYKRLLENCEGWTSCTSSTNVMQTVEKHKSDAGRYLLWYCRQNSCITLTVVDPGSENYCLNFKLKTKEKNGKLFYKFIGEHISDSIDTLMEKIKTNGISMKK